MVEIGYNYTSRNHIRNSGCVVAHPLSFSTDVTGIDTMSKHTTRPSQPELPFDEIEYGYCHCGCGQMTNIAPRGRTEAGWIRGQPLRFIEGHNARKFPLIEEPNPGGICMCGCGQPAPIASKDRRDIGHVKGRPIKYIPGHNYVRGRTTLAESFHFHCIEGAPDECWAWEGHRNDTGYGAICFETKRYAAHRVAYELHYGPIPDGLGVLHKCDNPPCCNWSHLFLGTNADNVADKVAKGRHPRGKDAVNMKVTEADVREMRRMRRDGTTQVAIARQFGLSIGQVSRIMLFKSWAHVTEEP